jgi:hypothetical protein
VLRYYSTAGYITTIKNPKGEEISLGELVDQYFGNPEDYFEVKNEDKKNEKIGKEEEQKEPRKEEIEEKEENETPAEKYKREQEEIKKWG